LQQVAKLCRCCRNSWADAHNCDPETPACTDKQKAVREEVNEKPYLQPGRHFFNFFELDVANGEMHDKFAICGIYAHHMDEVINSVGKLPKTRW
jgi:hypothetical protein